MGYKFILALQIFPALLQKGLSILLPLFIKLFRLSYTLGHVPDVWKEVKVVFIPKAGKNPEEPKSYRPINLTSFLLKTMEKIIDSHLRNEYLLINPLNQAQHAYQQGKSTISALDQLVSKVENTLENKEIALVAFLDIEGAFDNASHASIQQGAEQKGIEADEIKWMMYMLTKRVVTAKLGNTTLTVQTARGCPQGGVLSPLMWCMVMDGLLSKLTQQGFETIAYADTLTLMLRGMDGRTVSDRMQLALDLTWDWCRNEGLRANPSKTTIIPFTKRLRLDLKTLTMNGTVLELSESTKYLGVTLDKRLTWKPHITKTKDKAIKNMMACKSILGRRWGLKPRLTNWLYTSVIRPMMTYASFVWWPKTKQKSACIELTKVQRLACLATTGAMRTTPTIALEALLNLPPIHIYVQKEAAMTAFRDANRLQLKPGNFKGHLEIFELFSNQMESNKISDIMTVRHNFELPFEVIIPERSEWLSGNLENQAIVFYTDGSRKEGKVGIGVTGPGIRLSKALGSTPFIFQAEIHAIELCVDKCLKRGDLRGKHIHIASDSQAALKALKSSTMTSKLVYDCLNLIKQLATRCTVTLVWVPGHMGIEGNEIADELAKKGSEGQFIGPEPYCGYGLSNFKMSLKTWENQRKKDHLQGLSANSHSRHLIDYSEKRTYEFLQLNKNELSALTSLLTGHCGLKAHLFRIGKTQDALCRLCMEEDETPIHVLTECVAIARIRHSCLGKFFPNYTDLKQMNPRKILTFFDRLGLREI